MESEQQTTGRLKVGRKISFQDSLLSCAHVFGSYCAKYKENIQLSFNDATQLWHCTVKHHTDIINFACMTWNFVRIPASLSALCTNFERRKEKFNPRSPVSAPGDQSFRQIWFSFYAEKKLFVCRKNIWTHLNKQQMETLTSFNL